MNPKKQLPWSLWVTISLNPKPLPPGEKRPWQPQEQLGSDLEAIAVAT